MCQGVIVVYSNMNSNIETTKQRYKKRLHINISNDLYEKAIMIAIKKYGKARALSQIIAEALEQYINTRAEQLNETI